MSGAEPPVVALSRIRVDYGGGAASVEVDRLEVRRAEILVLIGPNGAGKSTLLRVIGLLQQPARGTVRFMGATVTGRDVLAARRRMATVFQESLLIDGTAFDNVALGLAFRGLPRSQIAPRVSAWLSRLGIARLADRRARTLSGGEAQRVALARALVLAPDLLLLDEPFAALDQPTRETLIAELGHILRQERIATVLVTHDRGEAMALGDRVAAMMDGRIVQVDETARLFRAPASEAVARFVGVETIVDCRVVGVDGGLITLEAGGQNVVVAAEGAAGEHVRLCIRPEDVTLSLPSSAQLSSSRNQLQGTVTRLVALGHYVRVFVDCGFPLVAIVTPRSVEDLGLAEGSTVVAAVKATAAHVIPRG